MDEEYENIFDEDEVDEKKSLSDKILEGHSCPLCEEEFYKTNTIIYAELTKEIYYYFHRRCLSGYQRELLEKLGFDTEEREGSTFIL